MEFTDNREEMLGELFKKSSGASIENPHTMGLRTEGFKDKFFRFEKMKKQELGKWWDGVTLEKYIENKRIPRGLRILIFPNYEDLDSDLLEEWEEGLFDSSYRMMRILVTNSHRKGKKIRDEVAKLEKGIADMDLKDATAKNYEILKMELTTFQIFLKNKKQKDFEGWNRLWTGKDNYLLQKKLWHYSKTPNWVWSHRKAS